MLDTRIKTGAEQATARLDVPARFLASWWVSENGWTWPGNNNVGNISFTGEGVPSGGVFQGVKSVESNKVCVYGTETDGVNAFVLLLETPKADKELTVDLADLHACGDDVEAMCKKVGESNWAESHYDDGKGPGMLIWDVYNSPAMAEAFAEVVKTTSAQSKSETPRVSHAAAGVEHTIREGETLSGIGLTYHVPVKVLAAFNDITDLNKIFAGENLYIPRYVRINPGDTVSALAEKYGTTVEAIAHGNSINPNYIFAGEWIFV